MQKYAARLMASAAVENAKERFMHGASAWILGLAIGLCCACGFCADAPNRFNPSYIDRSTSACDDFYQYACGGWMAANPRPPDAPSSGVWDILSQRAAAIEHQILENARDPDPKRSPAERLLGDYYASCMDETAVEIPGSGALTEELGRLARLQDRKEFAAELAKLHRMLFLIVQRGTFPSWVDPGSREALFGLMPAQDAHDSTRVSVFVDQGGLGLGNRNYYVDTDEATRTIQIEYTTHLHNLLSIADSHPVPRQRADRIVEMEKRLARAWSANETRINPNNVYHAYSFLELQKLTPSFEWKSYFESLGVAAPTQFVVSNPGFLQEMERMLHVISLEDWKWYLRSQVLAVAAPMLGKALAEEDFRFNGKIMQGVDQPSPRSTRCTQAVDRDLPDALGEEFVAAAFSPEDRRRVASMAQSLKSAMEEMILNSNWLDDATRREALAKIKVLHVRIGHPDHWHDYAGLTIGRNSWAQNAFAASSDQFDRLLRKIGTPPDRDAWFMTATTADAYSFPRQLSLSLPAALISPPAYDSDSDDPLNFGALGSLIGHEITHHFDTVGRHYDHRGNLVDWWTPKAATAFQSRAKCISKQYSNFIAIDDVRLNGEQTSSEDIADAVGLRIALNALRKKLVERNTPDPVINGFTASQRLFLGYAASSCTHATPQTLRNWVSGDRHSPPKFRVNGVVSNMPEFQQAFSCKKGQAMVHEPTCRVW